MRIVVDGMTAANDLGLTTAISAHIKLLVDVRLRPIKLDKKIHLKLIAPNRLYWADRPAMRVAQALHWMQNMITQDNEGDRVRSTLRRLFADRQHGRAIRDDLRTSLSAMPIWMQKFLRELLDTTSVDAGQP